jgi:hypothetical protein
MHVLMKEKWEFKNSSRSFVSIFTSYEEHNTYKINFSGSSTLWNGTYNMGYPGWNITVNSWPTQVEKAHFPPGFSP